MGQNTLRLATVYPLAVGTSPDAHWTPRGSGMAHRGDRATRCRTGWAIAMAMLLLGQTGCMVGPDYFRPAAPVAPDWIERGNPQLEGQPQDACLWWTALNDPVLDNLIVMAYQQNLTLREAGLRVLEARAQRAIAAGNLFPQLQQAFGQYVRTQQSLNALPTGGALPPGMALVERSFDLWSTGFDAAWELDFWGRFRRAIEAADADLDASVDNYDAVLVCLIAEVAAAYVQMRTFEERLALARTNVEIQQGSLRLADVRFTNGAVTELDVQQARSNLEETRSLIPEFEKNIRLAQNTLCFLLGIPPRNLRALVGTGQIPVPPRNIAVGVPADLLRRRPDVRRAEREAAAQSARIGIAVSDLYPRFSIVGTIGVDAVEFNELFTSRSFAGAISPGFRWNILNYGRLRNNIRVQEARFDQLAVAYQNTVLAANREVEDAIASYLREQERAAALRGSADAAKRSVDLALIQYRDGAIDFNRVFSLQTFLVTQQDQLAESRGAVTTSLIAIYKALGGGWEIRCRALPGLEEVPPAEDTDEQIPEPPAVVPDSEQPS